MDLDGYSVADLELVYRGAEAHDGTHVFVARRKATVERELAVDQCRQPVLDDLDIGGANRDCVEKALS